jgi:hypothetical protein
MLRITLIALVALLSCIIATPGLIALRRTEQLKRRLDQHERALSILGDASQPPPDGGRKGPLRLVAAILPFAGALGWLGRSWRRWPARYAMASMVVAGGVVGGLLVTEPPGPPSTVAIPPPPAITNGPDGAPPTVTTLHRRRRPPALTVTTPGRTEPDQPPPGTLLDPLTPTESTTAPATETTIPTTTTETEPTTRPTTSTSQPPPTTTAPCMIVCLNVSLIPPDLTLTLPGLDDLLGVGND